MNIDYETMMKYIEETFNDEDTLYYAELYISQEENREPNFSEFNRNKELLHKQRISLLNLWNTNDMKYAKEFNIYSKYIEENNIIKPIKYIDIP